MRTLGCFTETSPEVQFAAYKQFCDDTSVEKKCAIAEANERIDVLKADIQKYTADAARSRGGAQIAVRWSADRG